VAHESQSPVQALLQHVPSAQLPVAHWLPAVQLPPWAIFSTQVVFMQ
jgi:hypothetical protein